MKMRSVVVFVALAPALAIASPASRSVEGMVVDSQARWTEDRLLIVTEATVRTSAGDVVVSQLGGSVGGVAMRQFPGPEILMPGMRVAIAATEGRDLSQRVHLVVDSLRVLELPPGFVRAGPTKAGNSLFWQSGCVIVTPDAAGTNQVVGDNEFEAIESVIDEWNGNVAGCSYMTIDLQPPLASEVGRDGINLIKFRDVSWCRPATKGFPAKCHAPDAAGITTATFIDDSDTDRDGEILDADIELNGQHFAIAHQGQSTGTATCNAEITNTLAHEIGHLLGVEHTCRAGSDPARIDGAGRAVPLCSQTTDPVITEATMYNFQDCGETKKASVSPDDVSAICAIYPAASDPGVCEPVDITPGGCCNASDGEVPPIALVALTMFLVLRRKLSLPA